ncbi:MAG: alpha/beta hydrolase [Candidatus Thorarchaeota archaeon]|nr:alpha/beta hydrolase [Candidatus Thorarchaeota archaeon]
MKRQTLYFTIFIMSILIASSYYLSWTVDRGMGELTIDRMRIERAPGRPVDFLVYTPRTGELLDPMPIVLTLHGLAGSKEGMYAFNIELARRNFTVVSVDLAGHGDSVLPFIITEFQAMAEDAYAAVRYVQQNWANVDNESYGVLSHSLGFRVAIQLKDFPIAPMAYAAVGDIGQMSLGTYVDFPGNLLIAVGEYDEMITVDDALHAIRTATGNSTAEAGITYGSLVNGTAYRLALAPTDHVFEAIDGTIVEESISWLIQGIQGEAQLEYTLDPADQIYFNKTIATFTGALFLLVSVLPVMLLVYSYLPEKLKPRKIQVDTQPLGIKKTFAISSILGAVVVTIYTATSAGGFHLENIGLAWPNSMFATGMILFYTLSAIGITLTMLISMGKEQTQKAFASVGIQHLPWKEHLNDILKALLIALIGISWLLAWLALCGLPEAMQPWILIALVKWPVSVRGINTVIVALIAVPYLVADAAWIRGLLLSKREWSGGRGEIKTVIFAFASKMAVASLLAVFVVFGTTALGFIAGKMVLLGLLLLLILIVSILTNAMTIWTALKFENTWPAIIVSAFMFALVAVSSLPLI